jgi:hypothetical protein
MTLLLSLITAEYVMQASDRRVSAVDELGAMVYCDDDRNQASIVGDCLTFAYTGRAEVDATLPCLSSDNLPLQPMSVGHQRRASRLSV